MKITIEGAEALKYAQAVANGFDIIPAVVGDTLVAVLEDWDLSDYEKQEIQKFLDSKTILPF